MAEETNNTEQLQDPLPPATAPGYVEAQKLSNPPPEKSLLVETGKIPLVNVLPQYLASPYGDNYDRLSKPGYQRTYTLGVVPRKGWDAQTSRYIKQCYENPAQAIGQWATSQPLRLLHVLGDVHPMVSNARSLWLNIAFAEDDTDFIAVDSDGETHDEGTKAIKQLLEQLPSEVGGPVGLQKSIGEQVLFYGTAIVEAVLTDDGSEVCDIATVDPGTCRFRDETDGKRFLEQFQIGLWRKLPDFTVIAIGFEANRDNPYGRPLFCGAFGECLNDLARQQNLNDVLKVIAYPRLSIGFPFEEIATYAVEHPEVLIGRAPDGGDLAPNQYTIAQLQRLSDKLNNLKADDIIVYPKDGSVSVVNGAAGLGSGLAPIIEQQRLRICQGLSTFPSLLGITAEGGTMEQSSVNWAVQVKQFTSFRSFCNHVLCRALNVHLRLLGINARAKAETVPIQASDALIDAQALQTNIANQQALIDAGYTDRTRASIALVGEVPAVDDKTHEANMQKKQQQEIDTALAMKPQMQPTNNTTNK